MGVYINMEMPKEPDEMIEIAIFGDGKVVQTGESWRSPEDGKCYYTITNPEKLFNAVPVQPHGRLIDADALFEAVFKVWGIEYDASDCNTLMSLINDAPTIIPASEEGET